MVKINLKYIFQSIYIYILVILLCYNDFITGVKLGAIAQNPIVFLTPAFVIIEIYLFFKNRKISIGKIDFLCVIFIIYSILISLIYTLAFMYIKNSNSFQESSYIVKSLSYTITIIMLFITYRHSKLIFREFNQNSIYIGLLFALITEFFILGVELMTMPNAFSMLHFVIPTPYYRIRLWASEASISGFYVPILFSIAFYYSMNIAKSWFSSFICISFLVVYAIVSNSKGFYLSNMIAMVLFLIVVFFLYVNKIRNFIILISFFIFIPISSIVFYPIISEKISSSNEAVTFSTRFLDTISAIMSLLDYPFGSGFGIHQEVLFQSLAENKDKLNVILGSNIDTSEVSGFSYSLYGLDNKNLFNFITTTCGLFGIYLMYKVVEFFLAKKFKDFNQLYIFLFVLVSLFLSISFSGNYILAFYIAFVEINCFISSID
jgi:hypothetical protein